MSIRPMRPVDVGRQVFDKPTSNPLRPSNLAMELGLLILVVVVWVSLDVAGRAVALFVALYLTGSTWRVLRDYRRYQEWRQGQP